MTLPARLAHRDREARSFAVLLEGLPGPYLPGVGAVLLADLGAREGPPRPEPGPGGPAGRSAALVDREGLFFVRVETVWLVCRDPKDPGGTEISSGRHAEDENELYRTAAEAECAAKNVASELRRDASSLTWDGVPEWKQGDT